MTRAHTTEGSIVLFAIIDFNMVLGSHTKKTMCECKTALPWLINVGATKFESQGGELEANKS